MFDVEDVKIVNTLLMGGGSVERDFSMEQRKTMDPNFDYLDMAFDPRECPFAAAAPCPTFADFQYLVHALGRDIPFLELQALADVRGACVQVRSVVCVKKSSDFGEHLGFVTYKPRSRHVFKRGAGRGAVQQGRRHERGNGR